MTENSVSTAVANPLVSAEACFIVVPLHNKGQTGTRQWDGPFKTKDEAQRAAARWIMDTGCWSLSVFQLVGTVAKPSPDLTWYEAEKKDG